MIKDKYGNNIRRGCRVKDLSFREQGEGKVVGTFGQRALVAWDITGEEEMEKGDQLVVVDRAFR